MSTNSHKACKQTDCAQCETREISPLCSVEGAQGAVASVRKERSFKRGEKIFDQGQAPDGLYLLKSGIVKLDIAAMDGSVSTLRIIGPGQALGHRALFSDSLYEGTAVAVEDSSLCYIVKSDLRVLQLQHPEISINLLQQLSIDLEAVQNKWVAQVTKSAPARIAEALIFLDEHFHDQPWSRREIAQWAGTTTETVIRNLAQLERSGLILPEGRRYSIVDRERLISKSKQG